MRSSRKLRVAWLGPIGDFGVPGVGKALVGGLVGAGFSVDVYHIGSTSDLPSETLAYEALELYSVPNKWEWGHWYSRSRALAFVSSLAFRSFAHRALMVRLVNRSRSVKYDAIFRFSQAESFGSPPKLAVPPVLVHPCSHAAGELRWHKSEARFARQAEGLFGHYLVRAVLAIRAAKQRVDLGKAAVVIGPSVAFVNQLVADYGLDPGRVAVLRHPVDTEAFCPAREDRSPTRRIRLLYVARISARKGVDMVIDLSHRLHDLRGEVSIEVVGGHTLWSDYRSHLGKLNAAVASYVGQIAAQGMPDYLRLGDALLVPSTYEPGSLVFGEALASGLPVVASDAVGPIEVTSTDCCRQFRAGDVDEFERAVRGLVADLRSRWPELSEACRLEATTHFSPDVVATQLRQIVADTIDRSASV